MKRLFFAHCLLLSLLLCLCACAGPAADVLSTNAPTPDATLPAALPTKTAAATPVPEPETVWPATARTRADYPIAPLCAPSELFFRNVFGNAHATIEAQIEEYERMYDARRAEMENMTEEEAGALDSRMDFEITYLRSVRNAFSSEEGTHACMESCGIILSEGVLYQGGERFTFGFAAPGDTDFSALDIAVFIDGYPTAAYPAGYPLTQGENERYAIYTVRRIRDYAPMPETSLVEVRLGTANFVFRTGWRAWEPSFPQTQEQAREWLDEARALREAIPVNYACVSVGETNQTFDGLTFTLTGVSLEDYMLRVSGEITLEEGFDAAAEPGCDIFGIRLRIRGTQYEIGSTLFVRRVTPTDFIFGTDETYPTCWEMELPFHPNEILGEEIALAFEMPTRYANKTQSVPAEDRGYSFRLKIGAAP